MKKKQILNQCMAALLVGSMICQPIGQLAAVTTPCLVSVQDTSIRGKLENGLSYMIVKDESKDENDLVTMHLILAAPYQQEELGAALLTQRALFQGTKNFNREEIQHLLSSLNFDIEGKNNLKVDENHSLIKFELRGKEKLEDVLALLHDVHQNATLESEGIELSRRHLLDQADDLVDEIKNLTSTQVREFYAKRYDSHSMHLVISGPLEVNDVEKAVQSKFESPTALHMVKNFEEIAFVQEPEEKSRLSSFFQANSTVQELSSEPPSASEKAIVIDGKIWMTEPRWFNKRKNGLIAGAVCAAMGLIALFGRGPIAFPAFFGAGYFGFWRQYLRDPEVVRQKRKEDLYNGFEVAYQKGRAHITLTPRERRALFITETLRRSRKQVNFRNSSIALLADTYDLSDATFTPMFYTSEMNTLVNIKNDFIRDRNQWKMDKDNLEKELIDLTGKYQEERDRDLDAERIAFDSSYYPATKSAWRLARDQAMAKIQQQVEDGNLDVEEAELAIAEEERRYDNFLLEPSFVQGYELAERVYKLKKDEIQARFEANIANAKQSINYDARMAYYSGDERSLYDYYNALYIQFLSPMPQTDFGVIDWVDLRRQY